MSYYVQNTRQTYNIQYEQVITEVLVKFADENPVDSYETLIAMQKVNLKKNDTVEYTGCSDEQVNCG